MKIYITIFALSICFLSCSNKKEKDAFQEQPQRMMRRVMLDNSMCRLPYYARKIHRKDIVGKWISYTTYIPHDSGTCYYKIKNLDRTNTILIDSSNHYVKDINYKGEIDSIQIGDYFINHKNDTSTLILAPYINNEPYKVGDTFRAIPYDILFKTDSSFILLPHFNENDLLFDFNDIEINEYIKVKT